MEWADLRNGLLSRRKTGNRKHQFLRSLTRRASAGLAVRRDDLAVKRRFADRHEGLAPTNDCCAGPTQLQ